MPVFYYVDVKAEVADSWSSAVTYIPSNINYLVQDMSQGPCTVGFDISMADPNLTQDQFGPKRSEWRLRYGGTTINQGVITKVEPIPNDRVQIGGSDYLWYPTQRIFSADYTTIDSAFLTTPYISAPGVATDQIIEDIIALMNGFDSDTIIINVLSGGGFGVPLVPYTIIPTDTTTILDHINSIAAQDAAIGAEGFMSVDGAGVITLFIFSNRYQIPPSLYPTITKIR